MASGTEGTGTPDPPAGENASSENAPGEDAPRHDEAAAGDSASYEALTDEALLAECRVETFRAGGPGGQHQNRTESGVRLTHLPTGICVSARESRSQHRNRKTAIARLRAALEERARSKAPRIPTEVPGHERRRRLEEKRRRSALKRSRKKPDPDD